jgi:hypothetical protein
MLVVRNMQEDVYTDVKNINRKVRVGNEVPWRKL